MEEKNYLADITEIKNMMSKSSQFLSLSGLSGVLAGIYALIGALAAFRIMDASGMLGNRYYTLQNQSYTGIDRNAVTALLVVAAAVFILSGASAFFLSRAKARKQGEKIWNSVSRRLLGTMMIPLVTGGIFALLLLRHGIFAMVAPVTLIFYGLSCVMASRYTFRDIHYLGISITAIGLVATALPGYGLLFWALGFGICHIIYGSIMHFKYDRK
jgi:hypothetical protein